MRPAGRRNARVQGADSTPGIVFLACVLFAGFLLLLTVLAYLAGKLLARREEGGAGCVPGCAILTGFGLLSAAAFALFAFALSGVALDSLVGNGPIERVGLWIDEPPGAAGDEPVEGLVPLAPATLDAPQLLHVIVDVSGDEIPTERLRRLVEDFTDGDAALTVSTVRGESGRPLTRLDFAVEIEEEDARRLEEAMRRAVEEFDLPGGAYVDFRGLQRSW